MALRMTNAPVTATSSQIETCTVYSASSGVAKSTFITQTTETQPVLSNLIKLLYRSRKRNHSSLAMSFQSSLGPWKAKQRIWKNIARWSNKSMGRRRRSKFTIQCTRKSAKTPCQCPGLARPPRTNNTSSWTCDLRTSHRHIDPSATSMSSCKPSRHAEILMRK